MSCDVNKKEDVEEAIKVLKYFSFHHYFILFFLRDRMACLVLQISGQLRVQRMKSSKERQ